MRNLLLILFLIFFLVVVSAFCRSLTAQQVTPLPPTIPLQTPFPTFASITITTPTVPPPTLPPAAPVVEPQLPDENSEWYIDGWSEDAVVVTVYGREIRFDLAEFRNSQTNAAIVVQCIDPPAKRPNLDFSVPVDQRDRFIYRGNQFWHVSDSSIQRFIFLRHGELP